MSLALTVCALRAGDSCLDTLVACNAPLHKIGCSLGTRELLGTEVGVLRALQAAYPLGVPTSTHSFRNSLPLQVKKWKGLRFEYMQWRKGGVGQASIRARIFNLGPMNIRRIYVWTLGL